MPIDSQSVEAQIRLANTLAARAREGQSDSPAADNERAKGLVTQALALSPRSAYAHSVKAGLLRVEGRCDDAISEYEVALAFDRNLTHALFGIGICKVLTGLVDEAIQPLQQSISLDPRDPYIVYRYTWLGLAHLLQTRTAEAIVWFEKARSISPGRPDTHANLASAYALNGQTERAAAELAEARRLGGGFSSIARLRDRGGFFGGSPGYWGVPKVRAMLEATFFAGLRKAGVPED